MRESIFRREAPGAPLEWVSDEAGSAAPSGLTRIEELRARMTPEQLAVMDEAARQEREILKLAHPDIDPSEVMSWDGNTVELW